MKNSSLKLMMMLAALAAGIALSPVYAVTLDELLSKVRQSQKNETLINKEREQEFMRDNARRQQLLSEAKSQLASERSRGESLTVTFDANEKKLAEMEELLLQRMGNMGELFGVVRQVAGDTKGVLENSLVSSQIKDRSKTINTIVDKKKLPATEELENLWYSLLEEMNESGKVVTFDSQVVTAGGESYDAEIMRIGVFNVMADGKFLRYEPETDQLIELPRQPAARFQSLGKDLQQASSGVLPMSVDPSRGSILALLVQTPSLIEKIQQGKLVGYVILGIATLGLVIALYRLIALALTSAKVRSQLKNSEPKANNPLGRVMSVYSENSKIDTETLEYKIDEAILRETPKLQRGLSIIKILAVVAPLLGLLGTVTGMIQTFQSITLFGTGDPKLMADGISQALVTTVLGLVTAIPLTLLYSVLASRSKSIVEVLDEQSAGLIAKRAESFQTGKG